MKILFIFLLLAICAFAQDGLTGSTAPTGSDSVSPADNASLRAEVEFLKAQLAEVRLEFSYQMQVCQAPDLMQARLDALKTREAAKKPKEPRP